MTAPALIHHPQPDHSEYDDPTWGRPLLHLVDGGAGSAQAAVDRRGLVEIYRRRRFIATLVVTVIVIIATQLAGISLVSFGSLSGPSSATSVQNADPQSDPMPVVHVVRPGDTYGAIAASLGAEHPASFADRLRQANGGAELVVGQRLVVDLEGLD